MHCGFHVSNKHSCHQRNNDSGVARWFDVRLWRKQAELISRLRHNALSQPGNRMTYYVEINWLGMKVRSEMTRKKFAPDYKVVNRTSSLLGLSRRCTGPRWKPNPWSPVSGVYESWLVSPWPTVLSETTIPAFISHVWYVIICHNVGSSRKQIETNYCNTRS